MVEQHVGHTTRLPRSMTKRSSLQVGQRSASICMRDPTCVTVSDRMLSVITSSPAAKHHGQTGALKCGVTTPLHTAGERNAVVSGRKTGASTAGSPAPGISVRTRMQDTRFILSPWPGLAWQISAAARTTGILLPEAVSPRKGLGITGHSGQMTSPLPLFGREKGSAGRARTTHDPPLWSSSRRHICPCVPLVLDVAAIERLGI